MTINRRAFRGLTATSLAATDAVSKSPADGYTVGAVFGSQRAPT